MKPIRTLLTAALTLSCATASLAQEEPGVVLFEGPPSVITQRPDGTIVCEVGEHQPVVAEDGVEPLPWYIHATYASNQFAFDLYADLANEAGAQDNLFFSPISITAALALTYEGAAGNTQTQFEQVLHINEGIERAGYHLSLSELFDELDGGADNEDAPYDLTIANGLWGERTVPFSGDFLDTLNNRYDAGFESVDFAGNPEAQRRHINAWVEEQTNDKIVDLLPAGSITDLTRLVLANAIYFDADWQHPFIERLTREAVFQNGPRNADISFPLPSSVSMMTLPNQRLRYADLDGLDILELPYQSGDLSMIILLPDELADLEAQLSPDALAGWIGELQHGPVRVQMPKWEMRIPTSLSEPLQRLGLTDAFNHGEADFSRLSDSDTSGLAITDVVHQAFIRVDEAGTEAAAATAVVIGLRSAAVQPEPFHFTADHPFVYVIRHNETGAVLFIGRVVSPQAPAEQE